MKILTDLTTIGGIFGGFLIIFILIILAIVIVSIIATWKLFEKAGRKGYESIIPFYSTWLLTEIAGLNWWWFILLILNIDFSFESEGITYALSICSFIATLNCYYNIARRFGKDKGISVLAGIFPFIFLMIFAFSKNERYDRNIVVGGNGIFSNVDGMNKANNKYNNGYNNSYNVNENLQSTGNVDMSNTNSDNNIGQSTEGVDINNNVVNKKAFCGNCGNKLDDNARFCGNCGKEI